jgi:hypothetical protein
MTRTSTYGTVRTCLQAQKLESDLYKMGERYSVVDLDPKTVPIKLYFDFLHLTFLLIKNKTLLFFI